MSYDEGDGIGSHTADEWPYVEKINFWEEYGLGGIECVDSAEEKLDAAVREHVATCVPANVVEGVEFVGDMGYGCYDNWSVLIQTLV